MYYTIYKEDGAVASNQPVHIQDPLVARVNIDLAAPPLSVTSLTQYILKTENLGVTSSAQLFASISSETPMGDWEILLQSSCHPGSSADEPVALVLSLPAATAAATPAASKAGPHASYPTFVKEVKTNHTQCKLKLDTCQHHCFSLAVYLLLNQIILIPVI